MGNSLRRPWATTEERIVPTSKMKSPVRNKSTKKRKYTLGPAEKSLVAELVAEGLSVQDKFRPEPLYKQTGKGHYESKTVEEVKKAKAKGNQR